MSKYTKTTKRCPRCEAKMVMEEPKCPACGLIFSRLSKATNKAGKAALKKGEKNKVIYVHSLPEDVNKWKLFFMTLCLGFFGGNSFYVGRYKRGVVFITSFILLFIASAIFTTKLIDNDILYNIAGVIIIPGAFTFLLWVMDIVGVLTGKFKVPVSINEEYVNDKK